MLHEAIQQPTFGVPSKTDAGAKEFVKLPKGTCDRLVGGSLTAK